jgi:Tol biopolymer transport system component/DNA-binding winged helix-turn-helix (wHTH) protein
MNEQSHYIYEFGPFRLDAQKRLLLREGTHIKLFPKEFDTLLALVEHWGQVLEKDELMRQVWGDVIVEESNLTRNISHLRKLLGEKPDQHDYIVTVPGQGYRFVAGVRADSDEVLLHERTRVTLEQEFESATDGEEPGAQMNGRRRSAAGASLAAATTTLPATTRDSNLFPTPFKHQKAIVVTGLVCILAAAVTFFVWSQRSRNKQQKGATPIPFQEITIKRLTVNGNPRGASLSPDGKLFAYMLMDPDGKQSIWLGHVDGGEPIQLRSPAELIYLGLTFAPDGSGLYFNAIRDYSSDGILYKMPVFGGVAEEVKQHVRNHITFSREGNRFAFVRDDVGNSRSILVIADTKGSAERELISRASNLKFSRHSPSWSPDGSMIAVGALSNEREQQSEIFVISIADGSIKQLTARNWKVIRRMEWLNDSSGLIVVASETISGMDAQLWHVSYPNGEVRRIVTDLNTYGSLIDLSGDNKSLLAVQGQHQSNIWIAPADHLVGANQITFDLLGRMNGWDGLDWTPDGRLIFTGHVDQVPTLWAADADGNNKKQLLPSGYVYAHPTVTSDGRYIVFESNRSGSSEIWRANVDGGDMMQLTTGGNNSQPHVTPDGRWVLYKSSNDDLGALWRISINGGTAARLVEKGASWPRVSPNGKFIACTYADGKEKLAILSIEGGRPIKLFDVPRLANFNGGLRWTPDGKAVTYRDWANGIWKQKLEGGEPRRLEGLPQEKLYTYGWSRDGKLFAFTRGAELQDIVIIRDR